ncbi:hypothetical protein BAGA_15735 [Bacillus gaemokensis]|uniref:Uncharacterized protein n=1 Tax=Bacillus gaemokensis TaxID=574375 RepID=A0A073K6C9_9BACI|nr:hypothetical protein BAGA_15735 [Bacillus gaemokensis]KYG30299.1 hypothetical protein AZF08_13245 [Bacillus gaemokensis]
MHHPRNQFHAHMQCPISSCNRQLKNRGGDCEEGAGYGGESDERFGSYLLRWSFFVWGCTGVVEFVGWLLFYIELPIYLKSDIKGEIYDVNSATF